MNESRLIVRLFHLNNINVLGVLLFLFLFACIPNIQVEYNLLYRLMFVFCIFAIVFSRLLVTVSLSKHCVPILLCLFTFFIFWAADYGDRSFNTFLSFIRGLIIFTLSFAISDKAKNFQILSIAIVCSLLVLFQIMIGNVVFTQTVMESREEIVKAVSNNIDINNTDYTSVSNFMIVIVAHISFAAIISTSFLDMSNKKWVRVFLFSLLTFVFFFCIKSLWTAPIIILLASALLIRIIHLYSVYNEGSGKIISDILISLALLCLFILGISLVLTTFQSGEAYERAERLRNIFSTITGIGASDKMDLNNISSGRTELAIKSINGFLMSPLLGVGDFTDSLYISNHSSILDILARFGIVGFIPVIYMFCYYTLVSYRLFRLKVVSEHWTHIALLSFFLIFFISNLGNPYFLTSPPELLFFLAAGFVSGRYSYLIGLPTVHRNNGRFFFSGNIITKS